MRSRAGRIVAVATLAALSAAGGLLTLGAGAARAAGAPVVTTGAAAPLTSTSVSVAGSVDPNGLATTWQVEFGATVTYGSVTTSSSAGSGATAVDVSALLSGLTAGATYHYRFVAVNSLGTTKGADATFTTTAPPTATTGTATAVTSTSFTLAGSVDPRGRATTWVFDYGTTTAYGTVTTSRSAGSGSGTLDVTATAGGLTPGLTYHYRLVATSDAGVTQGSDRTFSTAAPPSAVTGAASALTSTSATVAVTVNPRGLATSWYLDYGTTTGYGSRTATRSAGSGTSDSASTVALSGLRAGTTYHYRIVATSAGGSASGTDQLFATVGAPDARSGPATSVTAAGATLTGSVDARNRPTTTYFEYGTTTGYGTRTTTRSVTTKSGDQNVAAAVTGLRPATTYHYRLVATSDAGTSRGADQTVVTASPPVPVTGAAIVAPTGTVTFIGTVQPNGVPTSWWFEWGTTTTYGSRTPSRSAGSGQTAATVTESITTAPAGSLLHYRLVVSSDAGTTSGSDASVRVGTAPLAVTGSPAAFTAGGAVVTGDVTPNGLATTLWVEYGGTAGYGSRSAEVTLAAAAPVRAALAGLAEGVTVHYRVVARNAAGTAVGGDATFVTPILPRTPSGSVVRCTIIGTPGNDFLRGTWHKDVICGLGGNDTIYGLGGSDVIYGGPGDDRIYGGNGADVVFAGAGADTIDGGYENDTIDGGPGNDRILAGPGRDTIVAAAGTDTVNGGPGADCAFVRGGRATLVSAGVCPTRK